MVGIRSPSLWDGEKPLASEVFMKQRNLFILAFSIGVPGAIYFIYLAIVGDPRFVNRNYDNFLLRYSAIFFCMSLNFAVIIYPCLVRYGLCTDYFSPDNIEKYKTRLFSFIMALPVAIFLCLTLVTNGVNLNQALFPLVVILAVIIYYVLRFISSK